MPQKILSLRSSLEVHMLLSLMQHRHLSINISTGNSTTGRPLFQRSSTEYDQVQPKPSTPTVSREDRDQTKKERKKKESEKERKKS
jgi:hypothetical protein